MLFNILDAGVDFGRRGDLALGPLDFAVAAAPVPEPASAALVLAGLLGLLGLRRRG